MRTCGSCGAYLLEGRDDCPFCGDDGSTPAADRPTPAPSQGSRSEERLAGPRGGHGASSGNLPKVLAVAVLVAVVLGGAFVVVGSGDGRSDRPATGGGLASGSSNDVERALLPACEEPGRPVSGARPLSAQGPRRVEVMIERTNGEPGFVRDPISGSSEFEGAPRKVEDVVVEDVEILVCGVYVDAEVVTECSYQSLDGTGPVSTKPLYTLTYDVTVIEATTGRVLETATLRDDEPTCPATFSDLPAIRHRPGTALMELATRLVHEPIA